MKSTRNIGYVCDVQAIGEFVHLSALRIVHCVRLKLTTEEFAVCARRSCSPVENKNSSGDESERELLRSTPGRYVNSLK